MNAVKALFRRAAAVLDDWLFPGDVLCLCCSQAFSPEDENAVCSACAKALEQLARRQEEREAIMGADELPEGIAFVHAAYPHEGQARRLVHALKYDCIRAAAVPLAAPMAYLSAGEEELIVPVPTDRKRKRKRGYNQATLLAEHLSATLGMPMKEVLVRTQRRSAQTGLDPVQRSTNLIGCMRADESVSGKRILLVDDVYTTGATAKEAARALLAAGAAGVGVFTATRAGLHDKDYSEPFPIKKQR